VSPKLIVVVSLLLFSGCGGTGESADVQLVEGQRFAPAELTVAAGEEILLESRSPEEHTITAYGDQIPEGADYFASGGASSEDEARSELAGGLIGEGEDYAVTLDTPGTYNYFCIPHESQGMKGTITVTE